MDSNKPIIDQDLLKKLQDIYNSDIESHIDSSMKNEMLGGTVRFTGKNDKEIVIDVKSAIYEKNEKGETTSPLCVIENTFYIPLNSTDNHDDVLKTFTDKLISCLSNQAKEVSQ